MFGFLGRMFGSDKALSSIVDGVSNGLDALVYTDEERAGDAAADRSEARKMVVAWMASTQGQNIARRFIALSITGVWLGMYLLSTFVSMVAVFADKPDKLNEVSAIAQQSAMDMNGAVMLILAFYFAAPHMGDLAKAAMNRFSTNGVAGRADRVG